ncbi:MAG: hypothetical protein ACKO96_28190, partial [Flammeovirgaceae bacterium]
LSYVYMKEWSFEIWMFFLFVIVIPVSLVTTKLVIFYLSTDGLLTYILKVVCAEIAFFGLVSFIIRSQYKLYIHHYVIGMCSLPLVCY